MAANHMLQKLVCVAEVVATKSANTESVEDVLAGQELAAGRQILALVLGALLLLSVAGYVFFNVRRYYRDSIEVAFLKSCVLGVAYFLLAFSGVINCAVWDIVCLRAGSR